MNLTQLKVFSEVMQTGSVSQAAKSLGRTQPAISLAIKKLEESIGIKLFERDGRRLVPVPEATYLLVEARSVLDRLATVSRTMQSLRLAQSGSLNIAAVPTPSAVLLPRFISQIIGGNPDIKISLFSRTSRQVYDMARTQNIDFGFADVHPEPDGTQNYSQEFTSADCFCALPKSHPLASKPAISYSDLHNIPMGTLQSDHPIYAQTIEAFQRDGATFNQSVESQLFLPLLQFISAGQCCAIVDPLTVASENAAKITDGQVVFKPLTKPLPYDYVILVPRHRPLSQLALKIKDGWKEELFRTLSAIGANPLMGH